MSFGIALYNTSGSQFFGMDTIGGVFIEIFTAPAGTSGSYTYTALNGKTLTLYYVNQMYHTFTASVDGSGNPVLTYTVRTGTNAPTGSVATKIGVFAK